MEDEGGEKKAIGVSNIFLINSDHPVEWHITAKKRTGQKSPPRISLAKDFKKDKNAQIFNPIFEGPSEVDTRDLTVRELRLELEAAGLKKTGTKSEMVERLEEHLTNAAKSGSLSKKLVR